MSSKAKKIVEECAQEQNKTLDLVDRSISNVIDIPGLCKFFYLFIFNFVATRVLTPSLLVAKACLLRRVITLAHLNALNCICR